MPFKYNPFTGKFDVANGSGGAGPSNPNILEFTAAISISALRPVKLDASGNLIYASNDTYENAQMIGISTTSGLAGSTISVLTFGELQDAFFSFSIDENIYLGSNVITNAVPTSGVYLRVGKAIKTDTIFIDIEETIIL